MIAPIVFLMCSDMYFIRDFSKNIEGNGTEGNKAQSSLENKATPRGNNLGTYGGANHVCYHHSLRERGFT